MKKTIFTLSILYFLTIFICGCSNLLNSNQGVFGKSSKQNQKLDQKLDLIKEQQSDLNESRLTHIGSYAAGVDYTLNHITNFSREILASKELNLRIIQLANKPDFNELKEISSLVDNIISTNDIISSNALITLNKKDKTISDIQNQLKTLQVSSQEEIKSIVKEAQQNAEKEDQYAATLKSMNSFFGLGAVAYGLVHFTTHIIWFLVIGSILFLIIRLAASANPIAGAILSVFESIISYFIKGLVVMFPKCLSYIEQEGTVIGNDLNSEFNKFNSNLMSAPLSGSQPVNLPISGSKSLIT